MIREAGRVEEDALHSSKGHYAASERWRGVHLWVGASSAVLTALAGVVVLGGPEDFVGVPLDAVFGIAAIVAAIATGVLTFLVPEKRSTEHHAAGDRYNALKGRARRFREIDAQRGVTDAELSQRLQDLADERDELNLASPLIPKSARKKAERGIAAGEAAYGVDGAR